MPEFVDTRNRVKSVFPEKFKELRNAIGISQEDFAKALGVSRASIGYYESGSRLPDAAFLAILSDLTGCDIEFLLGGNPSMIHNTPLFVAEYDLSDDQYGILNELLRISSFKDFLCQDVLKIFEQINLFQSFPFSRAHGSLVQSVIEYEVTKEFSDVINSIFSHIRYLSMYGDRDTEEVDREITESLKRLSERLGQHDEEAKKHSEEFYRQIAEEKEREKQITAPKGKYIEKIEKFREKMYRLSKPSNESSNEDENTSK
jgi:transcriptional regulator with XRE-family HTH domain